jgi:hypothetical protein
MSDKPKFEVIDRRKIKAEEEHENQGQTETPSAAPAAPPETGGGPHLVVNESTAEAAEAEKDKLPPAPTAQESHEQKVAYDASAQRLEDLIRAQNPAAGAPPKITFENLVQQFYVSALIQMGAGAPEGQQPRVDIMGARTTIDLLAVLAEKTKGNLNASEEKTLDTVLFEVRMAFLELTNMITMQGVQPPVPPTGKQ